MEFKEIKKIKTFEAGYSRDGVISVVMDDCALCGEYTMCIYIDGSEGEYGGASICKACVNRELA